MTDRGYQHNFSLGYESMHSVEGRQQKAATMVAVLREALGDRIATASVLNLGCSTGIIDEYIADCVASVTGVDIDKPAITLANSRRRAPNVEFQIDDAMNLSFADANFDVVICSQVYEHVPDPERMMGEIHRVLRSGGVCYFAATNRWALIEKHHRLPFLSWLPISLANRYMRLFGKGDAYYERHLGYRLLLKLVSRFRVEDYTGKLLASPSRYGFAYMTRGRLKTIVARAIFKYFRPIFPGYIWLLWKRES
jgi:2-polyprenyl-3-methyl-5-hydroxy-6-metoxy-1,4-benzoquinol methylase